MWRKDALSCSVNRNSLSFNNGKYGKIGAQLSVKLIYCLNFISKSSWDKNKNSQYPEKDDKKDKYSSTSSSDGSRYGSSSSSDGSRSGSTSSTSDGSRSGSSSSSSSSGSISLTSKYGSDDSDSSKKCFGGWKKPSCLGNKYEKL